MLCRDFVIFNMYGYVVALFQLVVIVHKRSMCFKFGVFLCSGDVFVCWKIRY